MANENASLASLMYTDLYFLCVNQLCALTWQSKRKPFANAWLPWTQILLSPAQDQYYRYLHIRPLPSLVEFPYSIIIHGSADTQVPLDDSIRLVESCDLGRCRLEVVDDGHALATLTKDDYRWGHGKSKLCQCSSSLCMVSFYL